MEYRPYYLSREWVRMGHQVRILAADFSHVRARQPAKPDGSPAFWHEAIDDIDYQWFATPAYQGNGIGRVRNIATFLAKVRIAAAKIVRDFKPDVVIASSTYPMDIWVARHLAKRANAKLVFEVHDLWPLSPIEINGMSPKHPFIQLCQLAENAAYKHADLVVSMLPNVHSHVESKGLPLDRLAIVSNGVDLNEWQENKSVSLRLDVQSAIDDARNAGESIVAYAGSINLAYALDTLLDAAALLQNAPVRFILVGGGHELERLLARVNDESLVKVQFLDSIPKSQIPSFLGAVDVAYQGALHLSLFRFGIAMNKMFDYMMAGVPILYAIEAGNNPIQEAGCGLTVKPENPAALADAIMKLTTMSRGELQEMGRRGVGYVQSRHSYSVLAKKFIDAMFSAKSRK